MTLIPYYDLPTPEREAIHAWLNAHDVDHADISAVTAPTYDPAANEWTFTRLLRADGALRHVTGEPATEQVTIKATCELPWRTA